MESSVEEDGTMKDLVYDAIEQIEHLYEKRGSIAGLTTGFPDLDRLIDGLQAPDLIVFGSRPSMGKTALSMNIAEHIAMDLVIVTAQLNRQADARGLNGQPPRLSDFRDCGSIEEDADIVGLLFRLEYYQTGQEIEQVITGEAELIIGTQRNGPTGEIPLTFLKRVRAISTEKSKA